MTMKSKTLAWIRSNRDWIGPDEAPKVEALKLTAEAMDSSAAAGKLIPGLITAYRQMLVSLETMKPGSDGVSEDDQLFGPAGQ